MSKVNSVISLLRSLAPHRLVTGNQSGDLDSIISAIAYSYFSHQHNEHCLPFLNFSKSELQARKDVLLAFEQSGIDHKLLYYTDDLPHLDINELILVDHNSPQGQISKLQCPVVGIIDHHEDEGLFTDAQPRIIEKAGSCSSLVAKYWLGRGSVLDTEITRLLLAPLVVDTRNLTSRVETTDVEVVEQYRQAAPEIIIGTWFEQLQEAKEDISDLSALDILKKDYKLFVMGVGTAEIDKSIGFSSIVKPFDWLLKTHTDFTSQMRTYLEKSNLDALVIMTSFEREDQFSRELAIMTKDSADEMLVNLALEKYLAEELELEENALSSDTLKIYNQKNIKASRKQVAPALKKALERL